MMDETPAADTPFAGPRVHRRRKVIAAEGTGFESAERAGKISGWALAGMAAAGLWALFATAAPAAVLHGGLWMGFGLLMILAPPRVRLGWAWIAAGLLVLAGAALALLPATWFGKPAWRVALEGLDVATGGQVTMQPAVTREFWLSLALSVGAGWYLFGHRGSDGAQRRVALLVAMGIAAYAVVSLLAKGSLPPWAWDPDPAFGLLANRNHTAAVLVMGALVSLGLLMEGVRSKQGALAGGAALTLAVSVGAVLGLSESRAGLLLLVAGVLAWLTGLGTAGGRYLSRRIVLTVTGFVVVAGAVFWWSDAGLRTRLEKAWEQMEASLPGPMPREEESGAGQRPAPLDFRLPMWQDTWEMIKREPLTGVGLGQFPVVFPQYRERAAIHAKAWHPESNWLMLVAEAGWVTGATMAVALGCLFAKALRAGRRQRGWRLTSGAILGAAVVPVHGMFDVPGHHPGIAWLALVLLALTFRPGGGPQAATGLVSRTLWRIAGGAVLLAGGWFFTTAWPGQSPPAVLSTALATEEVRAHYARDAAEKADPMANPAQIGPDGTAVDQLELAQQVVNQALRITPLEPELHYLKGLLSVSFSDEEAIADQAFAAQRLLEPDWVNVPWRQGLAWLSIDPARTISLWQEALRRAGVAHQVHPGAYWSPDQVREQIKNAAAGHPEVLKAHGF